MATTSASSRPGSSSSSDFGWHFGEGDGNVSFPFSWESPVKPELLRFGKDQSPVVVIDDFSGALDPILKIADALAPYPPARQLLSRACGASLPRPTPRPNAYVERTCEQAAQFIAGAFDVDGFDLIEASFSMVTAKPIELRSAAARSAFRFDRPEILRAAPLPARAAELGHGLLPPALDRNRAGDRSQCRTSSSRTAQADAARLPPESGYIHGSDAFLRTDRRGRGRSRPADHLSGQPAPFGHHPART